MKDCSARKPVKVIKTMMGLYEFVHEECMPTQLEVVEFRGLRSPMPLWRARVYEWGDALVFMRENRAGRYEVHQVRSTVGIRLAA